MSNASPRDEISRMGENLSPTSKPTAPVISKMTVTKPIFSNPNLLNSFFMCGALK